jgi:hypothetical protein
MKKGTSIPLRVIANHVGPSPRFEGISFRQLERYIVKVHGFTPSPLRGSGHFHYTKPECRTITLASHGQWRRNVQDHLFTSISKILGMSVKGLKEAINKVK